MSELNHLTAPTQFVEAKGIRFAYRRFGRAEGIPLVLIPHILGTMDHWDPAVTDGFAQEREVILFDNAGVASSSGEVPSTFVDMAEGTGAFVDALGLARIDLLGFSIGSMIAQNVAMLRPDLVRKLVLAGSGPRNGEGIPVSPKSQALFSAKYATDDDFWMAGFFTSSAASQAAGRAFLQRRNARVVDRDLAISAKVQPAQFAALTEWGQPVGEQFAYLKQIQVPVLVIAGSADVIFPTHNSYLLQQHLPDAQLVVYPDSSHGMLFQYPALFVEHTNSFLRH